ncbi:MAG: N-formylglutamate amidohydrolase [Alphaproteobacteria bacterium]|nr:N-formylglutamate amidohydrolase [Alphaproteobacteria bacterium]
MTEPSATLLLPGDPPPFELVNPGGGSTAVLICDHAANRIPGRLGDLGLAPGRIEEHIAWDPGAAAVARRLSVLLDAPLVLSGYSRLVVDCNRPPASPQSMAPASAGVPVPANAEIGAAERAARLAELFHPYHDAVEALLDERAGRPSLLLSIHSFTPDIGDGPRPWQVALAYGRDGRLARLLLAALRCEPELTVGDNQPYAVTDDTDYSIPVHGERRGIPHVLVEMRQDGLREAGGADRWAARLAGAYRAVEADALALP